MLRLFDTSHGALTLYIHMYTLIKTNLNVFFCYQFVCGWHFTHLQWSHWVYDPDLVYVVLTTTLQFSDPLWSDWKHQHSLGFSFQFFFIWFFIVCCDSLTQRNNSIKGSYRDATMFLFTLGCLSILLFVGFDLLSVPVQLLLLHATKPFTNETNLTRS